MLNTVPFTRDLVLVGGGHAHALVLRKWGMSPLPGARLTLINPAPTAPYSGMLPGHIAGHYHRDTLEIDLVRLARFAGARLIQGYATGIDRKTKSITIKGRGEIAYDIASIDVGITARMNIAGFDENAVGAKPLDIYASEWRAFLDAVKKGKKAPKVSVIGGGVAGCELAMAMAYALQGIGAVPEVTVIEAGPEISGIEARAREKLLQSMATYGVTCQLNARVERISPGEVELANQPNITAAFCVGAAGAFPHPWVGKTDLPLHNGFIVVDPDLRVHGDPNLFAVGDCAHMPFAPRPKAGIFAVRAAPILYHNLRTALAGGSFKSFKPQRSYLKLISLGGKSAMAEKYGFAPAGPLLWRWKDRIDRAFMDKIENLPVMQPPTQPNYIAEGADPAELPLCGGCGSKVGGNVLKRVIGADEKGEAPDIISSFGDDAAILRQTGGGFQVLSTDHLRAFIADPVQMTRIAAVHALGDIWAMGATPQSALANIILPRMSGSLQERTLREINDTAQKVFGAAGAKIIGGHTTMGAEMTLGFTVTGLRNDVPITLAGAKEGDVLVLTRPIGSGVIMAGYMAGTAPADVVTQALAMMEHPQDLAAQALKNAHAMTDITGFGLAGHVQAICEASGLRAEIWRDKVPLYHGARALSDIGIRSSLLQDNIKNAPTEGISDPLMHDPQTAGGLLAALAPAVAQQTVTSLQEQGQTAEIIGQLSKGHGLLKIS